MDKIYSDVEDMLCKELGEIARKGELTSNNLEVMYKSTDIIKDMYTIDAMKHQGYSNGYAYDYANEYARDYSGRFMPPYYSYDGHGSYDGRSYDGSYDRPRDNMGRYSGDNQVMEHLQKAMDMSKDERQREDIKKMMKSLQR